MPPGAGKSTLFTHDIVCWLVARDRTIRILLGSRTQRQANLYLTRAKRTLERDTPLMADPELVLRGHAHDAIATMSGDYGEFKPEARTEAWRGESLVVRQPSGQALDDKEATITAFGQDSGSLGWRGDLVIWDDLVDQRNTRTAEGMDKLVEFWTDVAENRIEPGGLIVLQGQRLAPGDLYRFCLDMERLDGTKKYRHISYPAHHENKCEGDHGPDAKAWPEGCLLDPWRLPWDMLSTIAETRPSSYLLTYQQDDTTVVGGMCETAWLAGGQDSTGWIAPGCRDEDTGLAHIDDDMRANGWSFITVDPSPDNLWGIGWWGWNPATQRLHLLDLFNGTLSSHGFLGLDDDNKPMGILEDWRKRSVSLGFPANHVVVEVNAAQKWLLSQPHVQKWQSSNGITVLPHQTTSNKNDPDYGIDSLSNWFRNGWIRLPAATREAREKIALLESEALRYPLAPTTDLLMMTWFATLTVTRQYAPVKGPRHRTTAWSPAARRGLHLATA
jgi:hypothetical protein